MSADKAHLKSVRPATLAALTQAQASFGLQFIAENEKAIEQVSSGRLLDAYQSSAEDYSVVTRRRQNNASQRWLEIRVGMIVRLRQKSSGRFLDAHENAGEDYSLVTRPCPYGKRE